MLDVMTLMSMPLYVRSPRPSSLGQIGALARVLHADRSLHSGLFIRGGAFAYASTQFVFLGVDDGVLPASEPQRRRPRTSTLPTLSSATFARGGVCLIATWKD